MVAIAFPQPSHPSRLVPSLIHPTSLITLAYLISEFLIPHPSIIHSPLIYHTSSPSHLNLSSHSPPSRRTPHPPSIMFLHQFFSNLHVSSAIYLLHVTQLSSSISSSSHVPHQFPHSFRHSYFPSPSNIAPHVLASISMSLPTAFTFQYPSHPPAHPISISIYPTLPLLVLHPIRLPSSTRPPFSLPHNLTSSADPGSSRRGSPVPRSGCPLRLVGASPTHSR